MILQNNLTDFLLCGFDIPNPIRRIRIKLPAENIEVLTAIANCFSKRDKRTIFKGFKVRLPGMETSLPNIVWESSTSPASL